MIKKTLVGVGLLALGGFLLMQTTVGSYTKYYVSEWTGIIKSQVPVEAKIAHIEDMINNITADAKGKLRQKVTVENEIADIKKDVVQLEEQVSKKAEAIAVLRTKVENQVASDNGSADLEKNKRELARSFNDFKATKARLKAKTTQLEARERIFEALNNNILAMKDAKARLEAELETVKATYEEQKARAAAENFVELDDSNLTEIKNALRELKSDLQVEDEYREQLKEFEGKDVTPKTKDVSTEDLLREIDQELPTKTSGSKT